MVSNSKGLVREGVRRQGAKARSVRLGDRWFGAVRIQIVRPFEFDFDKVFYVGQTFKTRGAYGGDCYRAGSKLAIPAEVYSVKKLEARLLEYKKWLWLNMQMGKDGTRNMVYLELCRLARYVMEGKTLRLCCWSSWQGEALRDALVYMIQEGWV